MSEDKFDDFNLEIPFEVSGNMRDDRARFYELARGRIEYQTRPQNRAWQKRYGRDGESVATYYIKTDNVGSDNPRRFVERLRIVVNKEVLEDIGKQLDFDGLKLLPYVIDHDIYEAWLTAKKGRGQQLKVEDKHLLARKREFYLAEKDGLGNQLLKFHTAVNPAREAEYKSALEYAKRRIRDKVLIKNNG